MPETIFCWRCRIDVPMLTEVEWAELSPHLNERVAQIQDYRRQHDCSLKEALKQGLGDALKVYERLTGFKETNPNALWHHRRSIYGPPCPSCGKPFRTPQARFCAACSFERTSDATGGT
jgi:hypothetical protein